MSQASQDFAVWLETVHPDIYTQLYSQAIQQGAHAHRLGALGDDDSSDLDVSDDSSSYDWSSFSSPTLTDPLTGDSIDTSIDSSTSTDLTLQPLSFDASTLTAPNVTIDASGTTGDSLTGAATSVGNWLTSAQGLTAVANLTTATANAVSTVQQGKVQMAVIQAQAARAASGASPLPITYAYNSAGQLVPVYQPVSGSLIPPNVSAAIGNGTAQPVTLADGSTGYTLSSSLLQSLFGAGDSTWILLGAAVVLMLLL
jgi:hypothetical protein